MHLRNVEIFCEVATRRSFSKAAEAHHVSQSSASQSVSLLEKRLGVELIDRSQRPLELTAAGRVYFDGCRELLESFRKIEDRVQRMKNKVTGRVRLAAIYSVGLLQMDHYVRQFRELYPEAELQLDYLHPDEVYSAVLNDEADLGLVSFPRDGGEIGCIPWQQQEMVLVVDPWHRLADHDSVPVAEMDGEDYVAFTEDLRIRKKIDRWLRDAKVTVNVVHQFDNIENIKRAVEVGAGIALLPLPMVRRELETGSLAAIRLSDLKKHRTLGIVHKRHKHLTTAADKFVELLCEDADAASPSSSKTEHPAPARGNGDGKPSRPRVRRTA